MTVAGPKARMDLKRKRVARLIAPDTESKHWEGKEREDRKKKRTEEAGGMGYKRAKKGKCKNANLGREGKDWRAQSGRCRVQTWPGAPTLHARWPLFDDAMPVAPGGLGGLWWVLICLAPVNTSHPSSRSTNERQQARASTKTAGCSHMRPLRRPWPRSIYYRGRWSCWAIAGLLGVGPSEGVLWLGSPLSFLVYMPLGLFLILSHAVERLFEIVVLYHSLAVRA